VSEAAAAPHVLYVDDDAAISRLVQKHLQRAGCTVTLASDGNSGIALARSCRFDVVALDHYMPGQDGLEVLAELRRQGKPPPVIFVTAAEEPRIAVTALKEGAADYVLKDVGGGFLHALSAAINRAIEQERWQREKEAAEEALRASRDRLEKLAARQAVLLREVNHRVANSLQLISSMLGMQARKLADPALQDILRRSMQRVEAVSLVHRRLYTSDDVEVVQMDQYLDGLVDEIRRVATADRQIDLEASPLRFEPDKAVPVGVIVNELVTNALKYAYPQGEPGRVRVSLTGAPGQEAVLVVEDDGVGIGAPPSAKGSGLGTVIVRAMAQTLGATLTFDEAHAGTRYVVRIAG
jgi:two-component sensor histidine kinase